MQLNPGLASVSWATLAAIAIYFAVSATTLVFAVRYLKAAQFMPYHAVAMGQTWDELPPRFQTTLRAILTVVGGGLLSTALTGAAMATGLLADRSVWFAMLVPLPYLLLGLPTLYATRRLMRQTGAPTPVTTSAISLLLVLLAFALSIA